MARAMTGSAVVSALECADEEAWPYRHWLLRDVLDPNTLAGLKAWPHAAPRVRCALGRREENNATRRHLDSDTIARIGPARALAEAFQDARVVSAIEARCGTSLAGTNLRIEYAQDIAGFWLEPHTDIGVKAFTMFIYLDDGDEVRDWGTDLYSDTNTPVKRLRFADNAGMILIPGADTWHGFLPREIDGVRRTLIINFVTSEWRSRHQCAYPDTPVG